MAHRTFDLRDEAVRASVAPYQATDVGLYRTRLQAVRLYDRSYTTAQIAVIIGCARSSLTDWCRAYRTGGIAAHAASCASTRRDRSLVPEPLRRMGREGRWTTYAPLSRTRFAYLSPVSSTTLFAHAYDHMWHSGLSSRQR